MALGEIADERALPALTAALKDEDAGVRRAAIQAIAELSDGEGHHHVGFRGGMSHPHPIRSEPESQSEPESEPQSEPAAARRLCTGALT